MGRMRLFRDIERLSLVSDILSVRCVLEIQVDVSGLGWR